MTVLPLAPPPAATVPPARVPAPARPTGYRVSLATGPEDVRAAQRLRHQVFAGELGARLDSLEPGLDSDAFDAYCDHLLVREAATGDVVATYRLLPPEGARLAGGLYAEGSSTSHGSRRSATTSSRSAAPASTPPTGTEPSSP